MDLKGKVVVVTGGCGLLGQEFVKAIVQVGGTPIIADINLDVAKEISSKIEGSDFCKLDITSKQSVLDLIEFVSKKHGKIDALVNNAYPRNKNYGRHFFDVEYDDFCENINMNLGGYFLVSQQFAKFFYDQGEGNIINISSIYGEIAPRFEVYDGTKMTMPVEYAAIKSALIHLTKYMAKYFKGKNLKVNCVSPGGILDAQPESFQEAYKSFTANKGMLEKSDLSGAVLFLLSDYSKYINGQNIIVDDGFTL